MTTRPRLIILSDTNVAPAGLLARRIESALAAAVPGAVLVVLRDAQLPVRRRLALGARIRRAARRTGQWLGATDFTIIEWRRRCR